MLKKAILFLTVLSTVAAVEAQNINVSSAVGQNIGNLIATNLLGDGVYVYNARFNGNSGSVDSRHPQIGVFQSNGYMGLDMTTGLVLTTGAVTVAAGPNNGFGKSLPIMEQDRYVDPEMSAQGISSNANGCATLDFDFVCLSSSISFTYCFGSEEYNEYVGTQFNDVFVFFLTGPDPVTGEVVTRNIAMIPGTESDEHPNGIPVAINTVNNGSLGSENITGEIPEGCYLTYSQYFYDNDYTGTPIPGVQYDGYTKKMSASAAVVPCESYHMHISVCNVGDESYDSGVFLEGHSFGTPVSDIGIVQGGTETVTKNQPKVIPISLSGTDYATAEATLRFGGQAVNGIDFLCLYDDGTPLNNGDRITLDQSTHTITVMALESDLTTPKSLDILFDMAFCTDYPQLLTHDTMRFSLAEGTPGPGPGHDGIETASPAAVALYPNPATDVLTVSCGEILSTVTILDAGGREVCNVAVEGESHTATLDISHLGNGVYTVRTTTVSGTVLHRALVK